MQKTVEALSSDTEPRFLNLDQIFNPARFALLLGVLFLVTYPDIILGSHAFFYRDAGLFGYPLAYYFRDCFWRGEIPLWNPYNDCGVPFLAQWNTLTLYPLSIFYLIIPLPWSLNFFIVGHVFLAGLGMYFLTHRWFGNRFAASVAGIAFAWNGLTLHALMWPSIIVGLAWMPWLILALEQATERGDQKIFLAAVIGAMQMLSGAPEIIFFTWLIGGGLFLLQCIKNKIFLRATGRFLAVVSIVIGLSAAQLLPFLELVSHGNRNSSYGTDLWSMPSWGIANFFVPLFRCTSSVIGVFSQDEQQWTSSYYCGIAITALAIYAAIKIRQAKIYFLGGTALIGVLVALGDNGLLLPMAKRFLPALGFVRYPIKFVIVTIFCIPLLASAAVARLSQNPVSLNKRIFCILFLFVSLAIICIIGIAFYRPFPGDLFSVAVKNGLTRIAFLAAIFSAFFLSRKSVRRSSQRLFLFGGLLLLGLDVCTHMPRQNPTVITRGYEPMRLQMSEAPRLGSSRALISREVQIRMDKTAHPNPLNFYLGQRAVLLGDCNLLEKIPKVNGFFPIFLRESYEVESLLYQTNFLPPLAQFLGASQITSFEHLFLWNERTNFMPMASIGQQPVFADNKETLHVLSSTEFHPRENVYLPIESKSAVKVARDPMAKIISSSYSAHKLTFATESEKPTLLVIAQSFYPLWKPFVDGKPQTLLRANHGFQAVEVPPGKHSVEINYVDRQFQLGAILSAITWPACLIGLFGKGKPAKQQESISANQRPS